MPDAAQTPEKIRNFSHVRSWVFDLDHTLYTMDSAQYGEMEERICRYVQRLLGLARDPAFALQKQYLEAYGTTLSGLIRHHGVDPDAYHDAINDIEALDLSHAPELRAGLIRLPGRRFVFTNNCGRFAVQVLDKLGIGDLFDGITDAQALHDTPKPSGEAFDILLAQTGLAPERAAMFDDSARNLAAAAKLGMTTVWFNNGLGQSHWKIDRPDLHIGHETDDLAHFLQTIRI